jgi:hypothetical protein
VGELHLGHEGPADTADEGDMEPEGEDWDAKANAPSGGLSALFGRPRSGEELLKEMRRLPSRIHFPKRSSNRSPR